MLYLLLLVAAGVGDNLVDRGLVVVLVDGVMRLTSVDILTCFDFQVFLSITLRILQFTSGPT